MLAAIARISGTSVHILCVYARSQRRSLWPLGLPITVREVSIRACLSMIHLHGWRTPGNDIGSGLSRIDAQTPQNKRDESVRQPKGHAQQGKVP
eukprot:1161856-Pelagomonas_calceolata.AAC.4